MENSAERVPKTHRGLIIRLVFLIGVCYLVFSRVDLPDLWSEFRNLRVEWFVASLAIWSVSIVLATIRWQTLLSVFGDRIPVRPLLAFHLVGIFYGQFLPGSITSDVVKGVYLARTKVGKAGIASSILVDRLVGIAVTGTLAIVALFSTSVLLEAMAIEKSTLVIGLVIVITGALFGLLLLMWFGRWQHHWPENVKKLYNAVAIYFEHIVVLFKAAGISMLYFFTWSAALWILTVAANMESISLWDTMIILAVLNIIQLIPISINGWGVREGALVSLLGIYGVPSEQALVYSLLIRGVAISFALVGGVLVLVDYKYKQGV